MAVIASYGSGVLEIILYFYKKFETNRYLDITPSGTEFF